ncbi:hypothetical protein FPZ12_008190 [Amycolatopsis acidicola]|uniref:UGSC-like domain-containing protein n=2 Tax=Amycolatopsis acidicola TaxID=2596893 RepID=A0A5N0VEX9_9PSEU|nr:hypothetical protein FPZ12_008190 [Amycolatopsis acidicola]
MAPRPRTVILDPVTMPAASESFFNPRPASMEGLRIAFVDNTKPNFDIFCDRVEELLLRDHGVAEVQRFRKPGRTVGVAPEIIKKIKTATDFAVTGLGD